MLKRLSGFGLFLIFTCLLCSPLRAGLVGQGLEISIGSQLARQIEHEYPSSEDSRVTAIGEKLVSVCDRRELKYRFKVLEMKEVNALSIGGGYVYVNRGLLELVKDDDQMLAFVLSHEIAHITQKHMAKSIERELLGGTLLGILLRTAGASEGTWNTTAVGWNLLANGYSRTYEFEADKTGLLYLLRAGFNPWGAISLFNALKKGEINPGIFVLLSTHPPTPKRIENLSNFYAREFKEAQILSQMEFLEKPVPLNP